MFLDTRAMGRFMDGVVQYLALQKHRTRSYYRELSPTVNRILTSVVFEKHLELLRGINITLMVT